MLHFLNVFHFFLLLPFIIYTFDLFFKDHSATNEGFKRGIRQEELFKLYKEASDEIIKQKH